LEHNASEEVAPFAKLGRRASAASNPGWGVSRGIEWGSWPRSVLLGFRGYRLDPVSAGASLYPPRRIRLTMAARL